MRYSLESDEHGHVEVLLFTSVSNAKEILSQVLTGTFEAAVLNASLIPDVFLVLVATSIAVRKQRGKSMSTRNVFTEILYNLSSTRNISKALQTFGIREDTKEILVVIPEATDEHMATVRKTIRGTEREAIPEALREVVDLPLVEKTHGITENEKKCGSLVDAIVTRMACRDIK